MGAYHNAIREEGTREDYKQALEEAWDQCEALKAKCKRLEWIIKQLDSRIGGTIVAEVTQLYTGSEDE